MSYDQLLQRDNVAAHFLVVVAPRRRVTGWTLAAGSTYQADFALGLPSRVWTEAEDLTESAALPLAAGEWYYDPAAAVLYVRTTAGVDPDTLFLIAEYELYFGTEDAHWHKIPDDDTTRMVYFPAYVQKSPVIKETTEDSTFGFMPIQSASITLLNPAHELETHLHLSSFYQAPVSLYQWLGDMVRMEDLRRVYDGRVDKVKYQGGTVQLNLFSRIAELDIDFHNDVSSFYSTDDFPNLDPSALVYPIRYVYGVVDNFRPVNLDYVAESPATSDNRVWGVIGEQAVTNIVRTVAASPPSTGTRTYLTSAAGLRVGDTFMATGPQYETITLVNYASNYIEHAAITPLSPADTVERGFVGNVKILQNNVVYHALYGRDYTTDMGLAAGVSGLEFTTSLESNLSMPATLSPADVVYCRVYGKENALSIDGDPVGGDDPETANLAHAVPIVADILQRVVEVADAEINVASFVAADADRPELLGIAIPTTQSGTFPKVRQLIAEILKSALIRIFIDADLAYSAIATAPMGAADFTLTDSDDEILKPVADYDYDNKDLSSRVVVKYGRREQPNDPTAFSDEWSQVNADSELVPLLHLQEKESSFETYLVDLDDAALLAQRLIYVLGDAASTFEIKVKKRFFGANIGDTLEITRAKLPGFPYDKDAVHTRKFRVTATAKSLAGVTLTLDDQKGIEDNSLNW